MKSLTPKEIAENETKLVGLLDKYYQKSPDPWFNSQTMFASLLTRVSEGNAILLVWDDFNGFISCDFKVNPVKKRKEAVIWTVYNPNPKYKADVLSMIEHEAKLRGVEAVVFFAPNPIAFNKLVKNFGYNCSLGYFEKEMM